MFIETLVEKCGSKYCIFLILINLVLLIFQGQDFHLKMIISTYLNTCESCSNVLFMAINILIILLHKS